MPDKKPLSKYDAEDIKRLEGIALRQALSKMDTSMPRSSDGRRDREQAGMQREIAERGALERDARARFKGTDAEFRQEQRKRGLMWDGRK